MNKSLFITGCSSGMGREIALLALEHGYRVALTARRVETLQEIVDQYPETALALTLDVTKQQERAQAVHAALDHFGNLDVLINNAGYGYLSAIEEGEDAQVRAMFETNFFGLVEMTKIVLPHMRKRGGGQIINNSSQAGLMANPSTGYYSASKYAVEGFTEALRKEVAGFNIRVTAVEPGPFRTDWAGRSMKRVATAIPAYAEVVGKRSDFIQSIDGKQPGDPAKAARAFIDLIACADPPAQLLLGAGLLETYRAKLAETQTLLDEWEHVTKDMDYDS